MHPLIECAEALADRIATLHHLGLSTAEIAAREQCCTRTVIRARRRRGLHRVQPPVLSVAEIAAATALLADGASYGEVARTLGRNRSTIAKHFPGRGWDQRAGGALGIRIARFNRKLAGVAQ